NAMGVGIPGTGMIGLPIAVAMAVVHGDPKRGLEVLTMPAAQVDDAKRWGWLTPICVTLILGFFLYAAMTY
ncbi:MAG: hypothetical protein J6Y66_03785, partial [Bacteroidales bacterium]|nr:hypothetical protein [Bacteroidales bacterium]